MNSTQLPERDESSPRINRRRLQLIVTGALTVMAAAYALHVLLPTYGAFSMDRSEKRAWKAAGFDDPEVRRKAYDSCRAGPDAQQPSKGPGIGSGLFPQQDQAERDFLCSPGWKLTDPVPPWWETPLVFVEAKPNTLLYSLLAVFLGPWLFGILLVHVLPAGAERFWRWLKTSDAA